MGIHIFSVAQTRDHPNWTGIAPRVSRFDGKGGFAPNSTRIPWRAGVWAAVFIAGAVALVRVGAAVFY